MKYRYEVLYSQPENQGNARWFRRSNSESLGSNLARILTDAGQDGWRVVHTGDFVGTTRTEIMLEKPVP